MGGYQEEVTTWAKGSEEDSLGENILRDTTSPWTLPLPNSPDLGQDPILGSLAYPVQTFPGPHPALPCSTKQMLADLIQFHPGDSLEEILTSSAPREHVSSQDSP